MLKYLLPVALLIGATAPAFAAEFYIVRGADKKCTIVETPSHRQDDGRDWRQGLRDAR